MKRLTPALIAWGLSLPVGEPVFELLGRAGDRIDDVGPAFNYQMPDAGGGRHWTAVVSIGPELTRGLLVNGRLVSLQGEETSVPPIAQFLFLQPRVNGDRIAAWPARVTPFSVLSGLFVQGNMLLYGGQPAELPGVPPGLSYRFFDAVRVNGDQVVVACNLDDADPPVLNYQVLLQVLPGSAGSFETNVLVQVGDQLPGMPTPIAAVADTEDEFDLNARGDVAVMVSESNGDTWVFRNDEPVLREGELLPSGVPLDEIVAVAMNDAGVVAAIGWTSDFQLGSIDMVVVDGEVFITEGDAAPGLPGHSLLELERHVQLTNDGRPLWAGRIDDAAPDEDDVLYLGRELLLREGHTIVNGQELDAFGDHDISSDGRALVFTAGLGPGASGIANLVRAILPARQKSPSGGTGRSPRTGEGAWGRP